MKTKGKIILYICIILAVLTAFYILGYQCAKYEYKHDSGENIYHSDTIYNVFIDSIPYPQPYKVIERDTFFKNVDTSAIIKEFYRGKYYYFPYDFGSLSFRITENSLFDYKLNVTTKTINNYIKPKFIIGVGGTTGIINNKLFIEASGYYLQKNSTLLIGVSYPVGIRVGYYYNFIRY